MEEVTHSSKHPEMLQLLRGCRCQVSKLGVEVPPKTDHATATGQRRMSHDKVPFRTGIEVHGGHAHHTLGVAWPS